MAIWDDSFKYVGKGGVGAGVRNLNKTFKQGFY